VSRVCANAPAATPDAVVTEITAARA